MKYYIFKVFPSKGEHYYILNNQYIGYMGHDSDRIRSLLEFEAKIKCIYQLYAESPYISDGSEFDQILHQLNCASTRFGSKEIDVLMEKTPVFRKSKDRTFYEIYYPDRNSSRCYLRSITQANKGYKTIKDPSYD